MIEIYLFKRKLIFIPTMNRYEFIQLLSERRCVGAGWFHRHRLNTNPVRDFILFICLLRTLLWGAPRIQSSQWHLLVPLRTFWSDFIIFRALWKNYSIQPFSSPCHTIEPSEVLISLSSFCVIEKRLSAWQHLERLRWDLRLLCAEGSGDAATDRSVAQFGRISADKCVFEDINEVHRLLQA
jgi:hypothetical protein